MVRPSVRDLRELRDGKENQRKKYKSVNEWCYLPKWERVSCVVGRIETTSLREDLGPVPFQQPKRANLPTCPAHRKMKTKDVMPRRRLMYWWRGGRG